MAEQFEIALIEKAALRVGMKSLMNNGAASCVYSEGCEGVSQEHLIAFAREVALHCAAALSSPGAAQTREGAEELSPEFTDTARAALLWVLWHHQGASSKVGQPIRFALGMGKFDRLNDHQISEAKRWAALSIGPASQPVDGVQGGKG